MNAWAVLTAPRNAASSLAAPPHMYSMPCAIWMGVLLLLAAGRSRSLAARLAAGAAGGALIGRAASGTGGIARLTRQMQRVLERQFNLGCARSGNREGNGTGAT